MAIGPVMLDLESMRLNAAEREVLLHPQTGGIILFTRNFESIEQLTELVSEVHKLRSPHLLVAVDHEGGRVQRFHQGFTSLPAANVLGQIYNQNADRACDLAQTCGWLMATELRAVGVDFSFAPVLDLAHGVSGVIGDRAFHSDPEIVACLAQRFMLGMKEAGMAAVGKHFPGHGGVKEDSHVELPVDHRTRDEILDQDMLVFVRMIHYGIAGIMPAHAIYENLDSKPAGFSKFWLQQVLRDDLGFQGAVFSDDLSMCAADFAGGYDERAKMALHAGCDMVLVCNHPDAAVQVLHSLEGSDNPVSQVRLARLHGRRGLSYDELHKTKLWQTAAATITSCNDSPWIEMDV